MSETDATCKINANRLLQTAENYTDFLSQFGKAEKKDLLLTMSALFAPDCHKIVNGKIVSKNILELFNQITTAKTHVGLWTVQRLAPVIIDPANNTIVLHFEIPTQFQGILVVIKYLICDNHGLIKRIDEIFNKKDWKKHCQKFSN